MYKKLPENLGFAHEFVTNFLFCTHLIFFYNFICRRLWTELLLLISGIVKTYLGLEIGTGQKTQGIRTILDFTFVYTRVCVVCVCVYLIVTIFLYKHKCVE